MARSYHYKNHISSPHFAHEPAPARTNGRAAACVRRVNIKFYEDARSTGTSSACCSATGNVCTKCVERALISEGSPTGTCPTNIMITIHLESERTSGMGQDQDLYRNGPIGPFSSRSGFGQLAVTGIFDGGDLVGTSHEASGMAPSFCCFVCFCFFLPHCGQCL